MVQRLYDLEPAWGGGGGVIEVEVRQFTRIYVHTSAPPRASPALATTVHSCCSFLAEIDDTALRSCSAGPCFPPCCSSFPPHTRSPRVRYFSLVQRGPLTTLPPSPPLSVAHVMTPHHLTCPDIIHVSPLFQKLPARTEGNGGVVPNGVASHTPNSTAETTAASNGEGGPGRGVAEGVASAGGKVAVASPVSVKVEAQASNVVPGDDVALPDSDLQVHTFWGCLLVVNMGRTLFYLPFGVFSEASNKPYYPKFVGKRDSADISCGTDWSSTPCQRHK